VKVAIVTPDWPSTTGGGVATLMATLADGIHGLGHPVEVWARGGGARTRALRDEARAYPVVPLPGRSWRTRGASHWKRGLPSLLGQFEPDGVVLASWDPLPGAWEPLRAAGLLPRVFAHGRDITGDPGADRLPLRASALGGPFRWLCLTDWMRGELEARGVCAERVVKVPAAVEGGLDLAAAPASPEPDRVLSLGRLVPRKGQDVLIDAVARLPSVHLDVVGEGPDRPRLQALIDRLRLEDRVTLHGHLPQADLEALWRRASLFALPVRDEGDGDVEGFGLVYLEAAARGVAAVGSRRSGAAEAIVHGETGVLLEDPLDADAIATTLNGLLADAGLRARLSEAAHARWTDGHRPGHLAAAVLADFEGRS
jgi:phosphatidyl-myo-inositol dimannoside synthase